MTLSFPSPEFDDAVAAVCHGSATEPLMAALNKLLRTDFSARDEYLLRVELHARLASDPALFSQVADSAASCRLPGDARGDAPNILSANPPASVNRGKLARVLALAACLMLVIGGVWAVWLKRSENGATSSAVAMLARVVDARWSGKTDSPRVGSALEPGWLRLESGLAQVVFYSGARVVIEGPTELQLVSPMEAVCRSGRLLAEVPEPASGFQVKTAQIEVVDRGTAFGIDATREKTEVHVFNGAVEFSAGSRRKQSLDEGRAAVVRASVPPRLMAASTESFAPMFEFQKRSLASEAIRYDQWRLATAQLRQDPSLVVCFDFENLNLSGWTLRNGAEKNRSVPNATIVGCQRSEGRWREKQALEFQNVNDRVRLVVPGDYESITLAAWVRIKGLDRKFNSLFMTEGFEPGTIHWLIRNDGVLGLTIVGPKPGTSQVMASHPVLTVNEFGMWIHLAAVLDGKDRQMVHYVNGNPVTRHALNLGPPFRVGPSELGNWNALSGPNLAPVLIRNFSGSIDEFELFSRALSDAEVRNLYSQGKPNL